MTNHLVSIIMPCYNAKKFIASSIESVINQTYQNWELIIIDDYSNDGGDMIVEKYARNNRKIKSLRNDVNKGVATSRNIGIKNAQGFYIAFLDADDIWEPSKLGKQITYMEENKASITFTAQRFINVGSEIVGKPFFPPKEVDYQKLLYSNVMCCSSVVVNSDIMKRHLFDTNVFHEDFAAWLLILREGHKAFCIEEILTFYRITNQTKSANKINSAKSTYYIYRKYLGFSFLKSLYLLFFYFLNGTQKYLLRK